MKTRLDKLTKHIAIVIVIVSTIIMGYIIYELSITKEKVAVSLVQKVMNESHHELEDFFFPVRDQLVTTATQLQFKDFYNLDSANFNQLFTPVIKYYPQITSLGIANDQGLEYDIIKDAKPNTWHVRDVNLEKLGEKEVWYTYRIEKETDIVIDSSWTNDRYRDPRSRPWFVGAIQKKGKEDVFWTDPYLFRTTLEAGITVSTSWYNFTGDTSRIVLAYDLAMDNLNEFTKNMKPTENGEVMIITGDKSEVVGLPQNLNISKDYYATEKNFFSTDSISEAELSHVIQNATDENPFSFKIEGITWWGAIKKFPLNNDQAFYTVIALPENDFLAEINDSQRLMAGGFFGILILSLLILRSHNQQHRQKNQLRNKNQEIIEKSEIIEKKNAEILDSINYAKRIQTAILPPFKVVNSYLSNSFILYLPKDIVAGDFYWMEHTKDYIMFAAADCTGHGVPGAMVSVMCHNALNRSVREFNLIKPNEILDKTRELVIHEFDQSESKMSDGMDISLCVLNKKTNELFWSGANNPLWIIRNGEKNNAIIEIKPNKQPIGNYIEMSPFTLHTEQLYEGDVIYIFTDGLQDQFGGKDNKKFKLKSMRKLFLEINDRDMSEQRKIIHQSFKDWKGAFEQVDDVCVIGVRL